MAKILMKGNEVIGAAAIEAGCKYFFGYPITPQSELPEYMSRELPKVGGCFLQAESEVSAINMVYGAAGAGKRVMTSTSSPGMALKQEGITYLAGAELPCVICNVMRGGPGLGGIQPSQSDYFQATRGGGNGDYRHMVYAPSTIQELADYVMLSFVKADQYRMPVIVLADGMIGQMMEAVEFKTLEELAPGVNLEEKTWATDGTKGNRKPNIINSLFLDPQELEDHNWKLDKRYKEIEDKEVLCETVDVEDADVVVCAYGTTSRVVKNAISEAKAKGLKVGLIRPITLWPFPYDEFKKIGDNCKGILVVEMSTGQMIDDVKIANEGRFPIHFNGRVGGMIPTPAAVLEDIEKIAGGRK